MSPATTSRRFLAASVATGATLLLIAGCGDDSAEENAGTIADATTTVEETTSTTTSTTETTETVDYEIDAQTFVFATNKMEILEAYVANEPNVCSPVDDGFVFTITAKASEPDLDPATPLAEVIEDACGEPDE